jgi:hypothetical protein
VLAFGAAPVKTAVLAGSNPAGTCDLSQGRTTKNATGSSRLRDRVHADLDLRCLGKSRIAEAMWPAAG